MFVPRPPPQSTVNETTTIPSQNPQICAPQKKGEPTPEPDGGNGGTSKHQGLPRDLFYLRKSQSSG